MMFIRSAWVVFSFEWRRAMGWSRLAFLAALALFPAAILWLIRHEGGRLDRQVEAWAIALFVLVPEMVCLLGLLLWATPVIHTEVEGKTWPYLVVRPAGKTPILLGKYAAAVLWTVLTGWLALLVSFRILSPVQQVVHIRSLAVASGLVPLSCLAYGALFVLLGVIFLRRGMIIAVAYTLFEFVLRLIPATVKQLTIQYHLQSLLVRWMGWDDRRPEIQFFFDTAPAWQHVLMLVAYAAVLFGVAAAVLRWRELIATIEP